VPIEQKDWTKEDRAAIGQNHPLDSTKRHFSEAAWQSSILQ